MLHTVKKSHCLVLSVLLFSLLLLLISSPIFGQIRTLRGKVTDEAGKPIVGAEVEIQRTDIARTYKTKTEKDGTYIYTGLPFGTYRIVS